MSWFRKRDHKQWLEVRNKLNTPQKLTDYLHKYYKWTTSKDKLCDNMQRPDQFVLSKTGDCDDFANFTYTILRYHKYYCELWAIFTDKEGHAITIVEIKKGMWGIFSNKSFRAPFENKDAALNWFYGSECIRKERIK